ncbi:PAS domain S-box protein [Mesorhizobium sp. CAU 1741]|uniref:PAS domain S-box protein n=1 Tax=Mesorhizobium sp. CAU 1741 TaxID=3140366 RepID=UPI00325AE07B
MNVDITDRLEAEQQAAESTRLREAIMQVSPDAIVTVDAEGLFIDLNPGAEEVFGYSREDVLGQEMDRMIVPASLRDGHRAGMKRYLATGEARILGQRLEMPALKADGTEFPAEIAVGHNRFGDAGSWDGLSRFRRSCRSGRDRSCCHVAFRCEPRSVDRLRRNGDRRLRPTAVPGHHPNHRPGGAEQS